MSATQRDYQEGRLLLAVQAFKQAPDAKIRSIARSYDIPHTTLADRLRGCQPRCDAQLSHRKLTPTEESALEQWILVMDERGFPPRVATVRRMANLLLADRVRTSSDDLPSVGENWVRKFIKRRPSLESKYTRKYDHQRALCEDPKIIRNWFNLVRNIRAKYGILDEDVYNFDETGFQMGVISTAKVITGSGKAGRPTISQPGNREWVTVIEAINSYGWTLPPMIIFAGKVHQAAWYEDGLLPHKWTIGLSENGWTNDKLGLTWLQKIFNEHTRSRTVGKYRLLILDGHGSHATADFDKYCSDNWIIPLYMPPHSSHLLQPLDVGCFSPLKRSYGQKVENRMRLGINHIAKLEFLAMYKQARTDIMTESNVRTGFAVTGLVPYNPDQVLSRLHIRMRTPTPPLLSEVAPTRWTPETPHNLAALESQTRAITTLLKRRAHSPPSPTNRALNQLVKGCRMAMHSAVLLASEVKELRTANEKQKRKRGKARTYIADGGVLTTEEGQARTKKRKIKDNAEQEVPDAQPKPRAPSKCSLCSSYEHTARTCLERTASN